MKTSIHLAIASCPANLHKFIVTIPDRKGFFKAKTYSYAAQEQL